MTVTKSLGPLHFEDLEPHRFEDLVRELIYDFKNWQSIEATGRSGSDDGFDIRAYERVSAPGQEQEEESEEGAVTPHPMEGNLWMIQCKRETKIGPSEVAQIIDDGVKTGNSPFGYMLVAPANFSKKSFDVFREKLRTRGVMEFYLWGRAALEDMLHMPKNDRVLFTFFGISLVTRRRSRATDIRAIVARKNKLMKILGEHPGHNPILVRDLNDTEYPGPCTRPR
jgi:Restriction endonuclease